MAKKPYVRIQSKMNIRVTCGLQNMDATNPDAHVPDRLKISPEWQKGVIMLKEGADLYPSEIVEWPTVKSLQKDGVITIGEFVDDATADVVATKEKLVENLKAIEEKTSPKEEIKLSDIAGEE